MRPVLFTIPRPDLFISLAILLVVALIAGGWLLLLHRRRALLTDHLYAAAVMVGMVGVVLLLLGKLNEIRVTAYGAMLMLGFLGGTGVGVYLGRRRGVPAERVVDLGLFILVGAVLGARLGYVLQNPGLPFLDLQQIATQGLGGLSFHGGLLGGFLAGGAYIYFTKLAFWRVTDALAPSVALGYAITRIGCFLNGCCYGTHTDLPWAMTFPFSPDGYVAQVHPTQLYASLMGFAMFGLLLWWSRGDGFGRAGRLFMALLMLEGVERFVMELFRQPDPDQSGFFSLAQIVSLALIVVGIIGWRLLPKQPAIVEPVAEAPVTPHTRTTPKHRGHKNTATR